MIDDSNIIILEAVKKELSSFDMVDSVLCHLDAPLRTETLILPVLGVLATNSLELSPSPGLVLCPTEVPYSRSCLWVSPHIR